MCSKDKAIAIGYRRALRGWVCRYLWRIALSLLVVVEATKEGPAQVLGVPSWTQPPSPAYPAAPGQMAYPSVPGQMLAAPPGSTFQAELDRAQQMGPAPFLGPNFSAVPSGGCPECGQQRLDMGAGMGMGPGPNPDRPAERLEGFFKNWLDPPVRYRGPGQPLLRESWLYRPYSFSWFMGPLYGGELIDDWVTQKQGYLGGFRLGWDFHHYWGCELRLAWGYGQIEDSQRAKDAQKAADDALNLADDDPFRDRFNHRRDCDLSTVFDFSFLYYPWGDSAWRPYFLAGMGYTSISFEDRLSQKWSTCALGLPLGVGLKFRWNDWFVLRFELLDTVLVPSKDLNVVNEFSFNAGVEVRFGGPRKAYWPWNPGLHYW